MGDFNIPDVNWSTLSGSHHFSNQFCEAIFNLNLIQLIDLPTHVHGNILDLIFVNPEYSLSSLHVHTQQSCFSNSDHYLISFSIPHDTKFSKGTSLHVYDYLKGDYQGLCDYLLRCDLTVCYLSTDVNSVWTLIKEHILQGMELFIPKVQLRSYPYPKWFSQTLRQKTKRNFALAKL